MENTENLLTLTGNDVEQARGIARLVILLNTFSRKQLAGLRETATFTVVALMLATAFILMWPSAFYVFVTIAVMGLAYIIADTRFHIKAKTRVKNHTVSMLVSALAMASAYVLSALIIWDSAYVEAFSGFVLATGVLYFISTQYSHKTSAISSVLAITLMFAMTCRIAHIQASGLGFDQCLTELGQRLGNANVQVILALLIAEMFGFIILGYNVAKTLDDILLSVPALVRAIADSQHAADDFDVKKHTYDFFLDLLKTLQYVAVSAPEYHIEDIDFSGSVEPAKEISGDFLDIHRHEPSGDVVFWIGDVCGKGANAGVVMASIQTGIHAVLTSVKAEVVDVMHLLDCINAAIYHTFNEKSKDSGYMTTMSVFSYRRGIVYFTGEHQNIILLKSSGDVSVINTRGYGSYIGMDRDVIGCRLGSFEFGVDDTMIIFSDGFIEQTVPGTGQPLGFSTFRDIVLGLCGEDPNGMRLGVIAQIKSLIGSDKFYDDTSLMILHRRR